MNINKKNTYFAIKAEQFSVKLTLINIYIKILIYYHFKTFIDIFLNHKKWEETDEYKEERNIYEYLTWESYLFAWNVHFKVLRKAILIF